MRFYALLIICNIVFADNSCIAGYYDTIGVKNEKMEVAIKSKEYTAGGLNGIISHRTLMRSNGLNNYKTSWK
jgi:hypothetical protein